jgi:DNA-binding LacI/PurR family transcriptional regulator
MRQPVRALGHEAADMLLGGADPSERRTLPHELIIRSSTAGPVRA